ncbi:hypothetical protein T492DRAFT_1031256 [Pavlovales sp. CCMP2436]|nr:hypothetical protein T492DRAFT_1031256 [Pavlovales sp. CCMP2436]
MSATARDVQPNRGEKPGAFFILFFCILIRFRFRFIHFISLIISMVILISWMGLSSAGWSANSLKRNIVCVCVCVFTNMAAAAWDVQRNRSRESSELEY